MYEFRFQTLVNKLITNDISVCSLNDSRTVKISWDTGANRCYISKKLVKDLSPTYLQPGTTTLGDGSVIRSDLYEVSLKLPQTDGSIVTLKGVEAAEINLSNDCDFIIGMNVIKYGELLVKNKNSQHTELTFEMSI